MPARIRRSGSEAGLGSTASNGADPALPVDEDAGLVGDRGDREDHVGGPGDVGRTELETDHERAFSTRRGSRRDRRVVGVDAADDESAELAGGERGHDRVARRGRRSRAASRRPRRWPASTRAAASATGRPPGSRLGRHRSRPRRGRRHDAGTQASCAPVLAARAAAAVSAPGTGPAAPRPGSPRWRRAVLGVPAEGGQRGGLLAGGGRDQPAAHLAQAARGVRRDREQTRVPPAGRPCAGAGRSCRPRPRAPVRPAPRSRRSRGRRRYRASRSVSTTSAARNAASSADCGRARKSMSLVPSATRANLL